MEVFHPFDLQRMKGMLGFMRMCERSKNYLSETKTDQSLRVSLSSDNLRTPRNTISICIIFLLPFLPLSLPPFPLPLSYTCLGPRFLAWDHSGPRAWHPVYYLAMISRLLFSDRRSRILGWDIKQLYWNPAKFLAETYWRKKKTTTHFYELSPWDWIKYSENHFKRVYEKERHFLKRRALILKEVLLAGFSGIKA